MRNGLKTLPSERFKQSPKSSGDPGMSGQPADCDADRSTYVVRRYTDKTEKLATDATLPARKT